MADLYLKTNAPHGPRDLVLSTSSLAATPTVAFSQHPPRRHRRRPQRFARSAPAKLRLAEPVTLAAHPVLVDFAPPALPLGVKLSAAPPAVHAVARAVQLGRPAGFALKPRFFLGPERGAESRQRDEMLLMLTVAVALLADETQPAKPRRTRRRRRRRKPAPAEAKP